MHIPISLPITTGQPLVLDLDDQLPPDVPKGGTWGFASPEIRHELQMRGFLLYPNGNVRYNCAPDAWPTNRAHSSARLMPFSFDDSITPSLPIEFDYEPGEPGIELPNGQVFKDFWALTRSSYWLQNYRSQHMVISIRPGTYYNMLGEFHWSGGVPRLTIQAKHPGTNPRLIKRRKLSTGEEASGHIFAFRNNTRSNPEALIVLRNLILEGGVTNTAPTGGSLVGLYGDHASIFIDSCEFVRGNGGFVYFPDTRPSGNVDDRGYYSSRISIERSRFLSCGNSSQHSSATHAVYVTHCGTLLLANNEFIATDSSPLSEGFDIPGGHMAKIGGRETQVLGNLFDNRLGAYTALLEFPYGGEILVRNNTLLTGDNTTGAGGPGGAQIQAMNEWAAHGIARRENFIWINRNFQVHVGTKRMQAWAYREKTITGLGPTNDHLRVQNSQNCYLRLIAPLGAAEDNFIF